MYENDAEVQARGTRGTKDNRDQSPAHPYSQGRVANFGEKSGIVGERILRTIREGAPGWYVGKIYGRLIQDAEERLAEARACIDWYQAEERRQLQKLEDLRQEVEALGADAASEFSGEQSEE